MSSQNPFRDPDRLSAITTGSSVEVTPGEARISHYDSNEQLGLSTPRDSEVLHAGSPIVEELTEDLPPAYTPAADVSHGESTVELGPRRPFQTPQVPPQPRPLGLPLGQDNRYFSPTRTGWQPPPQRVRPQSTGFSTGSQGGGDAWAFYADQLSSTPSGSHLRPAPPLHPSSAMRSDDLRPRSAPTSLQGLSDFARDFYESDPRAAEVPGLAAVVASLDATTSPSTSAQPSPSQGHYAPPSGRPPLQHSPGTTTPKSSRTDASTARSSEDDGRPTREPVPGHPLLRNGNALVYSAGYECPKCHNTGYKNYDPSHPCRKCWDKYAVPFSGALAYAPWNSGSEPTSSRNARISYQRPLPRFAPPQQDFARHRATQSLDATDRRPYSSSANAPTHLPLAGGGVLPMSSLNRAQHSPMAAPSPSPPVMVTTGRPPPGSVRLPPGDRRLGGILCWRCGGSGLTSFLIFDETTCAVCNGIGRTY